MSYLMKILTTFAMSMVPVVELRGGIPYGLRGWNGRWSI